MVQQLLVYDCMVLVYQELVYCMELVYHCVELVYANPFEVLSFVVDLSAKTCIRVITLMQRVCHVLLSIPCLWRV